jgi:hypothetical protein
VTPVTKSASWAARKQITRAWSLASAMRRSGVRERRFWAVPCTRQPEMREDPVNDGGVIDCGDQLHAAGTGVAAAPEAAGVRVWHLMSR